MRRFSFVRASDVPDAVGRGAADGARFLAGGTNLVDLMKETVENPSVVVDIGRLPLAQIVELEGGGLRLGALATNADTARDPRVRQRFPLLASAILAGASPQLRNAATNGGNLNQRTRCAYFYDVAARCNKREPGAGCDAIGGWTRMHAILGAQPADGGGEASCIAVHPSDLCVALAVFDAEVRIAGRGGERVLPFADYHRLPGDTPERDNALEPGELVTAIDLFGADFGPHHSYLKLRDRLSYAFALVSVACGLVLDGEGTVTTARIALGGVAHKPWRVRAAEELVEGRRPDDAAFAAAAARLLEGAVGQGHNDFKIELARRAVVRALQQAAAGTPQSQSDKRVA